MSRIDMYLNPKVANFQSLQTHRTAIIVVAIACILPVLAGYLLVQGPFLDVHLFFTPWHHDDFNTFTSNGTMSFWVPRPVSSNFAWYFAQFGRGVYYSLFVLVWTCGLVATTLFTAYAFDLRPAPVTILFLAFAGSVLWHCLASSVQSFQYLGLITNSLSYVFGLSAAVVFMGMRSFPFRSRTYLGLSLLFAGLVLLAAFAKEDMAAFLVFSILWSAIFGVRGTAGPARRKHAAFGLAVVILCYVASVWHSHLSLSPFVGNTGPYDISNFPKNVGDNLTFYLSSSPATALLYLFFGIVAVVSGLIAIRVPRARAVFAPTAFVLLCSGALMAPYLILPRRFDYYAMNFVPILAFSVAPLIIKAAHLFTCGRWIIPVRLGAMVLLAAGCALLYLKDAPLRASELAWMNMVRDRSYRELGEVSRAAKGELSDCKSVVVSGVDGFGPFLATNPFYLDPVVGRDLAWVIEPAAGTMLDQWGRDFGYPRWVYAKAGSPIPTSACRLEFDPDTLRARFQPGAE